MDASFAFQSTYSWSIQIKKTNNRKNSTFSHFILVLTCRVWSSGGNSIFPLPCPIKVQCWCSFRMFNWKNFCPNWCKYIPNAHWFLSTVLLQTPCWWLLRFFVNLILPYRLMLNRSKSYLILNQHSTSHLFSLCFTPSNLILKCLCPVEIPLTCRGWCCLLTFTDQGECFLAESEKNNFSLVFIFLKPIFYPYQFTIHSIIRKYIQFTHRAFEN